MGKCLTLSDSFPRRTGAQTRHSFVFLPKLIQRGMQADAQEMVDAFGKNEQVMKVIRALFIAIIGLVITKVLDTGMAQQVVGVITSGGL